MLQFLPAGPKLLLDKTLLQLFQSCGSTSRALTGPVIFFNVCVCVCLCAYICVCLCICICVFLCVYVSVCVCDSVCIHKCMYSHLCVCVNTHTPQLTCGDLRTTYVVGFHRPLWDSQLLGILYPPTSPEGCGVTDICALHPVFCGFWRFSQFLCGFWGPIRLSGKCFYPASHLHILLFFETGSHHTAV